jgi:group I intron endonuclease
MNGIIYKVTNIESGTSYIGQTTKTLKQRWTEHIYDATGNRSKDKGCYFHLAIKKYGPEAFKLIVLQECLNKEALDSVEKFYISHFNTVRPFGYNLSLGGSGVMHGRKMSAEARAKISAGLMGRPGAQFSHTPEARAKISASLMGNKRSVGRKLSDETKAKMRAAHLGRTYKKKDKSLDSSNDAHDSGENTLNMRIEKVASTKDDSAIGQ